MNAHPARFPAHRRRRVLGAVAVVLAVVSGLTLAGSPARAADPTPDAQNAVNQAAATGYRSAVAVVDNEDGRIWGAGDIDGTFVTESLVKLFIATRLLAQGQMSGFNETTAYKMITQSDDASANTLYGRVGGDGILPWTAQRYGIANLGAPPPSPGYWGATRITARGLAQFYYAVRWDPVVWPWLSNALHHATPYGSDGFYQFFGIPSATTDSGVKQGWGSDTPSGVAEQNSTGVIDGDRFAVVILTQGPGYGGALSAAVTAEAQRLLPGGWLGANRYAVLDTTGSTLAKDGNPTSDWVTVATGTQQIALAGTRYATVDAKGHLRVKDGSLYADWVDVADNVRQVAMTGARIAVLDTSGRVLVKEGGLNAQWVQVTDNATLIAVDGSRIGALASNGVFLVKEGGVDAPWVAVADGVVAASLATSRIGVLRSDAVAQVKEGGLTAPFVIESNNARDVQVTRSRVAVTTRDNAVIVKDGSLYADWSTVAVNVKSMVVRDNRVGVVGFDNVVLVKQGFLDARWYTFYSPGVTLAFG